MPNTPAPGTHRPPAPARHVRRAALIMVVTSLLPVEAALGQGRDDSPESRALQACLAHSTAGRRAEALTTGKTAEVMYRRRLATNPRDVEALVGTARVLSQCQLAGSPFAAQGDLSSTAMDLLEQALALQPDHWAARFVLASIAYGSPAFLGRASLAERHLDVLLLQQGDRTDEPRFAQVFEYRGVLFQRRGDLAQARRVWAQGAQLFPEHEGLRALLAATAPPTAPPALQPPTTSLETVHVEAVRSSPPTVLPSTHHVPRMQVLMQAGGAADVLHAVQSQPGATRVGEGSDIYTRGGATAETALLMNGGRMFSLSRFEGLNGSLFSTIEPFVVRSVKYSSGGFSVRHGNALSGVLDIETDGKPRAGQARVGASLVQASGTARAPLGKRAGGWISGRFARTDALLATHGRGDEFAGAPRSDEVIASLITSPGVTTDVRLTALASQDDSRRRLDAAGWNGVFHSTGRAGTLQADGRWVSSRAPLIVRMVATASGRRSTWDFGVLSRERHDASVSLRSDLEWFPSEEVVVRGGVERASLRRGDAGTLPLTPSVAPGAATRHLDGETERTTHLGGYAETELPLAGGKLLAGLRSDRLPGEDGVVIDPRLAWSRRVGGWVSRVAVGLFHQGSWAGEDAIPDGGTPGGHPTSARHIVAGLEREGTAGTVRVELFTKQYGRYREAGSGPRAVAGQARGLDLLLQRAEGSALSGWLSYSYLDATVRLENGQLARSPHDVTHTATASVTAAFGPDWSVGGTVRYGTGAPRTPILGGTMDDGGVLRPEYGAPMSERLPAYARADLRVMRFVRTPALLLTAFTEVINLSNRRNMAGITYDASYGSSRPVNSFFAHRTVVAGVEVQWR